MYESKDKMVSHPDHYQSKSGLEVIDVIKAFTAELKGIEATDTGNIIKYACRWRRKNGIQDLEKIIWYAQHLIDHLRKEAYLDEAIVNDDKGDPDVLMSVICGCERANLPGWTLSECEKHCGRYYNCDNVALANDILSDYELNTDKETK
jgi:hypothetical protein